jgi:hypothetical protein
MSSISSGVASASKTPKIWVSLAYEGTTAETSALLVMMNAALIACRKPAKRSAFAD